MKMTTDSSDRRRLDDAEADRVTIRGRAIARALGSQLDDEGLENPEATGILMVTAAYLILFAAKRNDVPLDEVGALVGHTAQAILDDLNAQAILDDAAEG